MHAQRPLAPDENVFAEQHVLADSIIQRVQSSFMARHNHYFKFAQRGAESDFTARAVWTR